MRGDGGNERLHPLAVTRAPHGGPRTGGNGAAGGYFASRGPTGVPPLSGVLPGKLRYVCKLKT